jgi:hypothetical protein
MGLRAIEFLVGVPIGYGLLYGSWTDLATQGLVASLAAIGLASLVERRPLAGWWAVILGASSIYVFGLRFLLMPECPDPHALQAGCVAQGTHRVMLLGATAGVVAIAGALADRKRGH